MAKTPVADAGTLWEHVISLSAAVRAKQWAEAWRLALDILGHINEPFECPQPKMAGGPDAIADGLDALAATKGSDPKGAFPWMQLLPLLLQLLNTIFGPKLPPGPAPVQT